MFVPCRKLTIINIENILHVRSSDIRLIKAKQILLKYVPIEILHKILVNYASSIKDEILKLLKDLGIKVTNFLNINPDYVKVINFEIGKKIEELIKEYRKVMYFISLL